MILSRNEVNPELVRRLTAKKFELVRPGDHSARIASNVAEMAPEYQAAIDALAPDAPRYEDASRLLQRRVSDLLA
jgi:hypothetical protein